MSKWLAALFDSVDTQKVRIAKFDDFAKEIDFTRVDFVKIDVEGFEMQVLRGMKQLVEGRRPTFLIEIEQRHNPNYREVFDYMASLHEPKEENPMLGFCGAARYAHPAYAAGFALECAALRRVREDMGLTNVRVMVPSCRRVEEAQRVLDAMASHGLKRGENGLEIYVMCEIPNNVIQIDAFAKLFDGFSIGSNDLTQLTLGVDRDSEIVAFDFDERDPGMLEMLKLAVLGAKRNGRHVGICGEAPANYLEIARYLAQLGIDSISVDPSSILRTMQVVSDAEKATTANSAPSKATE